MQGLMFASSPLLSIAFADYNAHYNSRVFPAGSRVDSSNFMPHVRIVNNSKLRVKS